MRGHAFSVSRKSLAQRDRCVGRRQPRRNDLKRRTHINKRYDNPGDFEAPAHFAAGTDVEVSCGEVWWVGGRKWAVRVAIAAPGHFQE